MSKIKRLFGGGSSTNNSIIEEQRAQAEKAEAKEAERRARLDYGRSLIDAAFGGGTVTEPEALWDQPAAQPAPIEQYTGGWSVPSWVRNIAGFEARPGNATFDYWRNQGTITPTGEMPTAAPQEEYNPETKSFTGIGQDFYDNYRKSLEDFYNPQVQEQYQEARSQNLFDLARRGLLRSSVATDRAGKLAKERALAEGQVASNIEGQVSGLQSDVNAAKQRAHSLLTQTEDPTIAANTALTEVNAIQSRSPRFDDLGNLFASALNSYSNYRDAQAARQAVNSIPVRSPYQSSGRVIR